MGIDHGGFYVLVPEEFLNGAYVVARLKKMGGKAVAEGMGGDAFVDPSSLRGKFD